MDKEDVAAFILTESHEFITNLLSYLPAKTLCICARVCKSWQRISQRLLENRHEMSWSCVNALEDTRFLPSCDSQTHPMASFESDLHECLETMRSIPRQAVLFTEFLSWKDSARINGSRGNASKKGLKDIGDIVRSKLPAGCSVLCLQTPGTVGTKRNLDLLEESESEGGISCLLFSDMKNIRIQQFSLSTWQSKELKKKSSSELLNEICGGVTSDVRCVLLFGGMSPHHCENIAESLQKAFFKELERIPVIAGALVRKVHTTESLSTGGLVFSGPNVQAASVILDDTVTTKEQVKKQLSSLKRLNLENGTTLGFMFACIGRGLNHYSQENLESQTFHECFPNTPLFGLFGNGEIGCENLTLLKDYFESTNSCVLPDIIHGYTTTIVLINIK